MSVYQWKAGTTDLSRAAGRAKWAVERLLGVPLPHVLPSSSREELGKLRAQASLLVDAYRNGMIALAADHPPSPEAVADLKRRYAGKILPSNPQLAWQSMEAMDALLSEWPPIGRKLEDLVSIIGPKPETAEHYGPGAVSYQFMGAEFGVVYVFVMQHGIIRSVSVRTH
jgi:hypothetical protein